MVQASGSAVADIHIRPLANRLHTPEYLYVARIVLMVLHISPLPATLTSINSPAKDEIA